MTRKMREALSAQDQFERLEVRRRLEKYGLAEAQRELEVWMSCPGIGLSGRIDMLVSNQSRASVVDFKLTAAEPGANLHVQLAAYGLMVEERLGLPVETVFIYRIPDDRLFPIPMTGELREAVTGAIGAIRALDSDPVYPEPTPMRARCAEP
jgi:CRISPR/Cas system-associated exonuclease Cas4 (RecB family)